jgi:hypothetical protein
MEASNSSANIFSVVFDFEKDSRNDMMNLVQYSVIAAVFVVLLNKGFEVYMPEPEKEKGAAAISFEIVLQIVVLVLGLFFIQRIVEFIPTVSGVKYAPQNLLNGVFPLLVILLSLNTGMGRKVTYLFDRLENKPPPKATNNNHQSPPPLLPHGINTSNPMGQSNIAGAPNVIPEPDFNSMFAGPNNPLANPQGEFEPMAANSFGGMQF